MQHHTQQSATKGSYTDTCAVLVRCFRFRTLRTKRQHEHKLRQIGVGCYYSRLKSAIKVYFIYRHAASFFATTWRAAARRRLEQPNEQSFPAQRRT